MSDHNTVFIQKSKEETTNMSSVTEHTLRFMEQSTEIEIKEKSESLLSPASEQSLRTNNEQIQSVSESGDQYSILSCL